MRQSPIPARSTVGERDLGRRSSSAWAKYADALRRISLARRSSRTSRSSSLIRSSACPGDYARRVLLPAPTVEGSPGVGAVVPLFVGDELPAADYLIIAIAEAELGHLDLARIAYGQALDAWPDELRDEGSYIVTADAGILWFESADELMRLREQAKTLLDSDSNRP